MRVYASTDCTRRAEYRRGGNAANISFSGCKRLTDAMAGRRSVSPEMRRAVSYAGFFLKPAVDPPDLLAMTCERVEVSPLPPLSVRVATHVGRKVLNLAEDLVRQQQALYQRLEIEPEVLPTMLGLQSKVEVEPVDVGTPAIHRDSAFAWGERRGMVSTYPVGVSSPDPTASLRRGRLFFVIALEISTPGGVA